MKALPRKAVILILQLVVASSFNQLIAQTDSIKTIYRQERADSSDYNYHRKYQYLNLNLKEEINMFKIAIPTFSIAHNNDPLATTPTSEDFSFYFEYERKLNPSWSFLISNSNTLDLSATTSVTTALNWGIRYYINMADQIKQGIRGNNCNGLYIDFFLLNLNQIQYTQNYWHSSNKNLHYTSFADYSTLLYQPPTLNLNLGLQKRLNNFSFIDTKIYMEFTPNRNETMNVPQLNTTDGSSSYVTQKSLVQSHFNFGLSFSIGLGWGWK